MKWLPKTILLLSMLMGHMAVASDEVKIYEGTYLQGFEYSGFAASGSDEIWWTSGKIETLRALLHKQRKKHRSPGAIYGKAEVKLKGTLSPKGHYGHMGRFIRKLQVTEILSAKKIE